MRPIFNNHQHVVTRVTGSFTALKKKKKRILRCFQSYFTAIIYIGKLPIPTLKEKED